MHKYTASPLRGHQLHAVLLCQELNFTVSQYQCRSCISRYRIIVHNIHGHGLNLAPLVANNCISCNPPTPRAHLQHHPTTLPPPATNTIRLRCHYRPKRMRKTGQQRAVPSTYVMHIQQMKCSAALYRAAPDDCQYQCWKVAGAGKINFGQFDTSIERQCKDELASKLSLELD